MQNIKTNSTKNITKTAFVLAIGLIFGFGGISHADAQAQSTYFVDITGSGCGNNCTDFYKYLTDNGITVTSTNNQNTSNNNGTSTDSNNTPTTPTTSYVEYPYYTYTNFATTDAYYAASTTKTMSYVQYPYYYFSYFENPAPKYDAYLAGEYPDSHYVYYGKNANEQMSKYQKTYTPSSSTKNTTNSSRSVNPNSGFTITSILN